MNAAIVVSAGVVVVVATVVVLVAGRREEDDDRQRTFARYVDAVNLLSVYVALFAAYAVVAQLTRFIVPERRRFGVGVGLLDTATGSFGGDGLDGIVRHGNDLIWRGAVQAALVLLAAMIILTFHRRQRDALVASGGFDRSAAARVDAAYRYGVCFVAAFVILMALALGLYGIFRIAAPGVAGAGGSGAREEGVAQAISLFALAGGAFLVFRTHWGPDGLDLRGRPAVPSVPPSA